MSFRTPKPHPPHRVPALLLALASTLALGACSLDRNSASGNAVEVVVGYQSKTINTVTAGTLLRAQGWFERRLAARTSHGGPKYHVTWADYDTGAPITAQMVAQKIDIGSMGDYPLLINGSRTQISDGARTELVSVTGYNPKGALNSVVVAPNSGATTLRDLAGQQVSASVGSAGHGTLVQALTRAGIDPKSGVRVLNQQPQVGASALVSGQVAALSQFVAWPGLLVFQHQAKLLYDGAELNVPTFHGVVVRRAFAGTHPEVLDDFLQAQLDATDFIVHQPLAAARVVAEHSGLPAEVVYLYNGPGGTSFDTTLKPSLVAAFKGDVPYLKSIGNFADFDIGAFVADGPLRRAFAAHYPGQSYDAALATNANPDPGAAGEVWLAGTDQTQSVRSPAELLRAVRAAGAAGKQVRAAYVADAELGTRWFADQDLWLRDGDDYLPFTTPAAVARYRAAHPAATVVSYSDAVAEVSQ